MRDELLILCSLKATVILIAACVLCAILRRASAATRHLVWTLALAALLHELAHVARRDVLTLAMAEFSVAMYWFHPLAWWAASRMRQERERACDDRVLAAGVGASGYAADLLEVARGRHAPQCTPAMARASSLEARLRAILDPSVRRRAVSARGAAVALAVALVAMLPLASLRLLGQGGGLSGTVYDESGAVVPDAKVTIVNTNTGLTQTIASGPAGNYSFPDVPSGLYQVKVGHPGFEVFAYDAVAAPTVFDVKLRLGRLVESLVVSGRR